MTDPVLIIGAGVSGLALAQGLLSNNIPFRLFERDSELNTRTQGYRFRISEEGIEALTQNLSSERLVKLEASCCAEVRSQTGNVPQIHLDANTAETSNPLFKSGQQISVKAVGQPWSVDRGALRYALSSDLGSLLEYGKELDEYEEGDGVVTVKFKDGSTAHGCFIVGADGAWSKVRSQLIPSYALVDTEGRLIYGKTEITAEFTSKFSSEAMKGLTFVRDGKRGFSCLLEPMVFRKDVRDAPRDYVYWVLFFRKDQLISDQESLSLSQAGVETLIKNFTADWDAQLRCIFDDFAASLSRVLSVRPPIPSWNADSRVTLIGDAAHPMAPTAAYGATTALQDAGVLTKLIQQNGLQNNVCAVLREYEAQMKQYAGDALQRSSLGGKAVFGMRPFDQLTEVERAA